MDMALYDSKALPVMALASKQLFAKWQQGTRPKDAPGLQTKKIKMFMKKQAVFLILVFIAIMSACSPRARIIISWRDPESSIDTRKINKFMVAALLKNQSVRRTVEDNMASLVPGKAIPSYQELGSDSLKENDAIYNQKLKAEGFDGVVVMRLVNTQTTERFIPGSYPVTYGTWGRYWSMSWTSFYTPGYYTTDKTFQVEVNVYSLRQDKLIWSATSSTVNPQGKTELFDGVSRAVYRRMKKEGFLQ